MADYDALDHGVSWKWKRSFDSIKAGVSPPDVAKMVIKALTATIRNQGGFPYLDELTLIAEGVKGGQESGGDALAHVNRVERAAGGSGHIRDAGHVAKRLIIEIAQGDMPSVSCREEITERFCKELIEKECFARARSKLIGETWLSYAEQTMWQAQVDEAMKDDIAKIVQRLIRDPSGRTIKAPPHPRRKPVSLEALLNRPLDE